MAKNCYSSNFFSRSSIFDPLSSTYFSLSSARFIRLVFAQTVGALPALLPFSFLRSDLPRSVLDGNNAIRLGLAKTFLINLFDENRQGSFPPFLLFVCHP